MPSSGASKPQEPSGQQGWGDNIKEVFARARALAANLDDDYPERHDSCGCFKPNGCYGSHGWHWEILDVRSPQGDMAYERCEAYWAKADRYENEEERGAPW